MEYENKKIYFFLNSTPKEFIKITEIPNNISIIDYLRYISYGYNRNMSSYQLNIRIENFLKNIELFSQKDSSIISLTHENRLKVKVISLFLTNKQLLSFHLDRNYKEIFLFIKKYLVLKDVTFGISSDKLIYNQMISKYIIGEKICDTYEEAEEYLKNNKITGTLETKNISELSEKYEGIFDHRFQIYLLKRNYHFITNSVKFYSVLFCVMALYGFYGFYYLSYSSDFHTDLSDAINNAQVIKFRTIKTIGIAFYLLILSILITNIEVFTLIMNYKDIFKREIQQNLYDAKDLMINVSCILFASVFFFVFCFVGVFNNYNIIFKFVPIIYNTTIISLVCLQYVILLYLLIENEFLMILSTVILFLSYYLTYFSSIFKILNYIPQISLHYFFIKSYFKKITYSESITIYDPVFWDYLHQIFFDNMFFGMFYGRSIGLYTTMVVIVFLFLNFLMIKLFLNKFKK
ncbi:hypothetical protein H312_01697 [Anncaliia algerae PRA339]|uniref:Uncharacterized protein n=1 Tax=Anncaliia algerae PRA339 TaxID=1288291 RepID=A0A059F1I6_9MICR|nr:hypothetical protein H312_01697 [Anncaliia algerae PRA339]